MHAPLRPGDPTRLGEYDLLGRLGQGGMGTVFVARAPSGRTVAIKMVRPEFSHDAEFRGRFRSEVNRARQVPPFSTAEVLDADPDHDPPYLVIEYVDGPSLATVVRDRGPLSGSALHGVAVGIATALAAIHGAGVIHRDLKPGNVLLAEGGVKVIDFGIARALEATSQHTRTDQMVGTVAYMSPERFDAGDGQQVTSAADVFAWGAVVAYAATGRTPFAADSAPATAMRILTQPPDLSGLPDGLRDLVAASLAKEPRDRPTAQEVLGRLVAGYPPETGARAATTPEPPAVDAGAGMADTASRPPTKRQPVLSSAAAAVAVVALLAGGLVLGNGYRFADDRNAGSGPFDEAVPSPVESRPPSGTGLAALPSILNGDRRTLIHIAEIDRDLSLHRHDSEVQASDGTGAKSQFVLQPVGVDYLIRSLRSEGHPEDRPTCIGVKVSPDRISRLVAVGCNPTKAAIFGLSATGKTDDKGRPTYFIRNDAYGFVQWSTRTNSVYVQQVGDASPLGSFSFVDRGPL